VQACREGGRSEIFARFFGAKLPKIIKKIKKLTNETDLIVCRKQPPSSKSIPAHNCLSQKVSAQGIPIMDLAFTLTFANFYFQTRVVQLPRSGFFLISRD
jgi:hypothetical protein